MTDHASQGLGALLARPGQLNLQYFEDVLAVEFAAVNARRREHGRADVKPLAPAPVAGAHQALVGAANPKSKQSRIRSPDPRRLFAHSAALREQRLSADRAEPPVDPDKPDYDKTRPQPVPCDANGLAFSGGGIRSAAICLGVLQAFHAHKDVKSVDYLSTVSGGGYIGACLSAATCEANGRPFPFGDDVFDSSAVAHLRNYSNYLMPRGRSSLTNVAEAGAIILRGLVANLAIVLAAILFCVLVTLVAWPDFDDVASEALLPRLLLGAAGLLTLALLLWAVLRSQLWLERFTDDNSSWALTLASFLLKATVVLALFALQPLAIAFVADVHRFLAQRQLSATHIVAAAGAFSGAVSAFSGSLGGFLKTSERAADWTTFAKRIAIQVVVFVAALILPVAIWVAYLDLSLRGMSGAPDGLSLFGASPGMAFRIYLGGFCFFALVMLFLRANGYSLHRFYRDRLSKAFLFCPPPTGGQTSEPLDGLKLSALSQSSGPYHIINSALNVEGSKEANRRGRNADFFMFTRDFVGSDLTHYARSEDMERIDPRLDVATAMAISGAAVSANMGSATIRLMSPTLALLNIQLGYWLRNPLDLATATRGWRTIDSALAWLFGKFYLLGEMLNQIDEKSRDVLLTDGGHIENLGVYELLKRGCQLIIVVDAEADPSMSFPALLTLERYARIDLGVRIVLPWEEIATMTKSVDAHIDDNSICSNGPHCAVGQIFYQTGDEGIIVCFKSSLTGDENDYILDYKKRYPSFPHETTGDQFFSEEQFEVYRALGYHMADGVFGNTDGFSFLSSGRGSFADREAAMAAICAMLDQRVAVG